MIGFAKGQVQVKGTVTFQLTIDSQSCVKTVKVDFLIMFAYNSAYNNILRKPSLNKIEVIVSMPHLLIKFPICQERGQV